MRYSNAHLPSWFAAATVALGIWIGALNPAVALAQSNPARAFPETGYTIADDAIWAHFEQFGGAATFGAPVSREFHLLGAPVQLFENAALAVQPDGSVALLPLAERPLLGVSR